MSSSFPFICVLQTHGNFLRNRSLYTNLLPRLLNIPVKRRQNLRPPVSYHLPLRFLTHSVNKNSICPLIDLKSSSAHAAKLSHSEGDSLSNNCFFSLSFKLFFSLSSAMMDPSFLKISMVQGLVK